jgi:predicted nucleotidyltransferase
MSGVTGYGPIKGRKKFQSIVEAYKKELQKHPQVKDIKVSGSFLSNPNKTSFGDIDLIVTVAGITVDQKKEFKKEFAKWITQNIKVDEFKGRYEGRKYYNAGELISVAYKQAQVDNIIATSETEADFKLQFLNLPAEKQGLILGILKAYFTIQNPSPKDVEYQYNLSSKELQLRKSVYHKGTLKEKYHQVTNTWTDWKKVEELLENVGITTDMTFDEILEVINTWNTRARNRIAGVFGSMVSVKSGEVNTEKGKRKEEALAKVSKLRSQHNININKENKKA